MIAPGAFRNKMNTQVRNKTRELEKMKRDLVKFATFYIMSYSHVTNKHLIFENFNLTEQDYKWFSGVVCKR